MSDVVRYARRMKIPAVSPYLMQPIRTHEQATRDIAASRAAASNVVPFIPAPGKKNARPVAA